ncbi:40S ribosomal protein S2 [Sciurus carolinensis]|uniref:40S ribosomal protein S2 n=1 Tax=Sciurus carolinensis TaxID=30640 RepID=A0AA41NGB3_SCICA|nr:40S ribosomal protein S2 [Sciurus carolinensis]
MRLGGGSREKRAGWLAGREAQTGRGEGGRRAGGGRSGGAAAAAGKNWRYSPGCWRTESSRDPSPPVSQQPPEAVRYWHCLSPCAQEAAADGCIDDCYTSARGCTATLGSFAKATLDAISKTYSYLTPDLWKETVFTKSPYQEFTDHLVKTHIRVSVQRTLAPAVATT